MNAIGAYIFDQYRSYTQIIKSLANARQWRSSVSESLIGEFSVVRAV
jgi:hypothetical protein